MQSVGIGGKLYGVVCPEALFSPRNGPSDQNNMLERIFMVLIRMFQAGEAGQQEGQLESCCPCSNLRATLSPADRWKISLSPRFLFFPGSGTRERI